MSYTKNTWVDQDVERPKTYEVTNNQDGSITLTDSFGLVQELGTPVNAVNMNHIEDGIDGCAIRKHNLTETFNLGEWVLGGSGDDEGFYKSLIANNVGNAVTDDTKWEKDKVATDLNGKANVSADNFNATGTTYLSGLGMPSSRYIDLTLGASGTTYTAPANGWFAIYIDNYTKTETIPYLYMYSHIASGLSVSSDLPATTDIIASVPLLKGDTVGIAWGGFSGGTQIFRFFYAEGTPSE